MGINTRDHKLRIWAYDNQSQAWTITLFESGSPAQLTNRGFGSARDQTALVFTSPNGSVLRHSNFYRRYFKPAVEAFRLGGFRFHELRHTCAAMLIADGAHPRAIMERLGHSSIKVTLDTYGHLFPALDEALTDEIGRASCRERV